MTQSAAEGGRECTQTQLQIVRVHSQQIKRVHRHSCRECVALLGSNFRVHGPHHRCQSQPFEHSFHSHLPRPHYLDFQVVASGLAEMERALKDTQIHSHIVSLQKERFKMLEFLSFALLEAAKMDAITDQLEAALRERHEADDRKKDAGWA